MRLVLSVFLGLATVGCAPRWEAMDGGPRTVAVSDFEGLFDAKGRPSALPFGERGDVGEGRWKALPATRMELVDLSTADGTVPSESAVPAPAGAAPRPEPEPPRAARLPVPTRRTRKAKRKPTRRPVERDPARLARERFIAHPTLIRAQSVTLFCPAAYRRQVRLSGTLVESEDGGVRHATGDAQLLLRELTIQADEILVRPAPADDVQILARGGAGIASRMGKRVVHEEGLRSLIIKNDRTIPIP